MERFVNNEILHACFGGMYYGCYPFGFIYIYITALGFVKPTTLKAPLNPTRILASSGYLLRHVFRDWGETAKKAPVGSRPPPIEALPKVHVGASKPLGFGPLGFGISTWVVDKIKVRFWVP